MNHPKVSVLILSYNGKYLLEDSISSYLANDYENFDVVIIDNGSSDGTKEYVETNFPQAKLIRLEKNKGYSGGFNFGLEYVFKQNNADYALVTYYFDEPGTLQTVGKKEHPVYWNGGHIGNNEKDLGQYNEIAERYFADDIFTLVNKKMYDEIGAYDENFRFQSEEYDWQARAKDKGYKIFYAPNAKIWHKESMTIGKQSPFKAYYDARNPMLVILKYKSPEFFRKFFWTFFKKDIVAYSLLRIKKLRPKVAWNTWKGFFSGLSWGFKNHKFTRKHFIG
jgi:GT2 family glycosyltransferase